VSEKGNAELWLVNTSTGQRSRFTLDAADHSDSAWTRDGSRLALAGSVGPVGKLVLKATDGSGAVEELMTGDQSMEADSVSPDGKTVLYTTYSGKTGYDLFTLSVSGDHTSRPFVQTAAQENLAQFSPNGRFVAYESDATGLLEIYVAAFPQPGDTWQVSQKGAHSPRWSKDGTELFFIDRDNWLQTASVDTSGTRFEVKSIRPLFQQHDPSFFSWSYDVFPDGKHFLVGSPSEDDAHAPIALVTEWDRKPRSP
jgi:Tol biopolymer transport system component